MRRAARTTGPACGEPRDGPVASHHVDSPHRDEIDSDRQSKFSKAAKLIGLAAGLAMFCGCVVVASTISHLRQAQSPPMDNVSAPVDLTGASALRPDVVSAQLDDPASAPSRGQRSRQPPPSTPAPSHNDAAGGHSRTANTSAPTTAPASTSATGTAPQPAAITPTIGPEPDPGAPASARGASAAAVVREFYQLVPQNAGSAATLLSPALLASDLPGFVRSWGAISQVRVVSVQPNADGTVQAIVCLLQPSGIWLRIAELLTVTPGDTPLISGAELLSAQHG